MSLKCWADNVVVLEIAASVWMGCWTMDGGGGAGEARGGGMGHLLVGNALTHCLTEFVQSNRIERGKQVSG